MLRGLDYCLHPFIYEVNGDLVKSYMAKLRERFRVPHLKVGKVLETITKFKAPV